MEETTNRIVFVDEEVMLRAIPRSTARTEVIFHVFAPRSRLQVFRSPFSMVLLLLDHSAKLSSFDHTCSESQRYYAANTDQCKFNEVICVSKKEQKLIFSIISAFSKLVDSLRSTR